LAQVLPRKNERTPTTKSLLVFFGAALHFSEIGSAQAQTVSVSAESFFSFSDCLHRFPFLEKQTNNAINAPVSAAPATIIAAIATGDVPRSNATYPYIILMSASFTAVISRFRPFRISPYYSRLYDDFSVFNGNRSRIMSNFS
ncbi:MAG: hypothetical protein ACLTTW_10710, partial [Coprobacter sp.]